MLRVNAEVDSAHALLLGVNVTQMSVEIAGSGNEFQIYLLVLTYLQYVAQVILAVKLS